MDRVPRNEWEKMTQLISLTLTTGALSNCQPQSLIIIGDPGSGKSAILDRFYDDDDKAMNPKSLLLGNVSQWGLRNFLRLDHVRGVTHLIIPEFQTLFLRRLDVWAAVEGILLQGLSEGVGDYANGPEGETYNKAKFGVIAAMTRDSYMSMRMQFKKSGLLSRFLVVRWRRNTRQIKESIMRKVEGDYSQLSKVRLNLPDVKRPVILPRAVSSRVLAYCEAIRRDEMNRSFDRFCALTQAVAFRRDAKRATVADWNTLLNLSQFWQGEV